MMTPELKEAARNCPFVSTMLKRGETEDEIILMLVKLKNQMLQDVAELKLLVPKRVRMSDGRLMIWRCQEEYIPIEEFAPVEIGNGAWKLKQAKIQSDEHLERSSETS